MFDLLKEYLRAKIKDPIITKHTVLCPVEQVCMKMGLHSLLICGFLVADFLQ
jgi:hypothetical protein